MLILMIGYIYIDFGRINRLMVSVNMNKSHTIIKGNIITHKATLKCPFCKKSFVYEIEIDLSKEGLYIQEYCKP